MRKINANRGLGVFTEGTTRISGSQLGFAYTTVSDHHNLGVSGSSGIWLTYSWTNNRRLRQTWKMKGWNLNMLFLVLRWSLNSLEVYTTFSLHRFICLWAPPFNPLRLLARHPRMHWLSDPYLIPIVHCRHLTDTLWSIAIHFTFKSVETMLALNPKTNMRRI